MSLAKINKRSKLMWDNAFNPIGLSSIDSTVDSEGGKASLIGYIDGQEVKRRFVTRIVTADDIANRFKKFSFADSGETGILFSCNCAILPENAPITPSNVPVLIGEFNSAAQSPSSTTFIHVRQIGTHTAQLDWATNTADVIKEGSVVYIDFQYIVVKEGE